MIVKLQRILDDSSIGDSETDEQVIPLITAFNNVSEQIVNLNAKGAESMAASLDKSHLVTVVLWMFISAENEKVRRRKPRWLLNDDDIVVVKPGRYIMLWQCVLISFLINRVVAIKR